MLFSDDDEEKLVYSIMFNEICHIEFELKNPIHIEVSLKENIKNVMKKLKEIGILLIWMNNVVKCVGLLFIR